MGKCRQPSAAQYKFYTFNIFQFTFKCGYNDFISKYTDINSLHVTQIDLLHNDTFLQYLIHLFQMWKRIFACKISDDFSGFVDTCRTGKRNRAGALVLGNGSIQNINLWNKDCSEKWPITISTCTHAPIYPTITVVACTSGNLVIQVQHGFSLKKTGWCNIRPRN